MYLQLSVMLYSITTENHNQKFKYINFYVCTLYIELLSISSAFIFMFVHYIDKVELLISVLLPVKKNRYTLKRKIGGMKRKIGK